MTDMSSLKGTVVLNVDDTDAIRYAKTRTLERAGYKVIEAATGAEALALAETGQPALVLLDVKLPDMSGTTVCELIKRDWPHIMVLQISATFTTAADKVQGLNKGADTYLTQPVEPAELLAAVAALLRLRAAEDQLRRTNEILEQRVEARTSELASANEALQSEIAERERVEAVLRQSQKMEAVGHLTGGIAHDFNNLLMAVLGNLELLKRRLAEGRRDVEPLADNAIAASRRAAALTQRLLAFARRQPLTATRVDVREVVEGLKTMLKTTLSEAVAVKYHTMADVWPVRCDQHQLENAVLNLVINARDAMHAGGTINVTAENMVVDEGPLSARGCDPGEYVRVAVTDYGSGMSEEVLAKVFDPFFTTKPIGQGTGLGLSMVYSFARQSGGCVVIDSVEGEGTTVAIFLPRASLQDAAAPTVLRQRRASSGSGETVLLVEDEPLIRSLIVEALVEAGYACLEAGDGAEALALAERGLAFDLLVTDVGLPGMDGIELATRLRSRLPALKVILASGHAQSDATARQVPGAVLLAKPFDLNTLATTIHALLAEEPEPAG